MNVKFALTAACLRGPMSMTRVVGADAWGARAGLDLGQLQGRADDLKARGYRPFAASAYVVGDVPRFCDIWRR